MKNAIYILLVVVVFGFSFGYVHPDGPGDLMHLCWEHNFNLNAVEDVENFLNTSNWPDYTVDNLMIRTDPNDASGSSDEIVSKTGTSSSPWTEWIGEKWDVAFISHYYGGIRFGGYADNDNTTSNQWVSLGYNLDGWLKGETLEDTFPGEGAGWPENSQVHDVYIIHDSNGDGSAYKDSGAPFAWYLTSPDYTETADNVFYDAGDILFGPNELRGDVYTIAPFTDDGDDEILPKMIICEYRPYDACYLEGERVDASGLVDVLRMGEYWLTTGNDKASYYAEGADWDRNGTVNLLDFALMAAKWDPALAENQ